MGGAGKARFPRRSRRGISVWLLAGLACVAAGLFLYSSLHEPVVATAQAGNGDDPYRVHRDIQYARASADPVRNQLDVYEPVRARSPKPVVVWVHGGGWYQGGKRASVTDKARRFTREGNVFVSVNYRLSPDYRGEAGFRAGRVTFPDHPADVASAIAWVTRNIAKYGGDRRRIVLIGHSAGAQIVSLLGTDSRFLRSRGVNPAVIRGVISLDAYGLNLPFLADPDIQPLSETHRGMYWNAFGAPWEPGSERRWRQASAIRFADRKDPPFLLVVSSDSAWRVKEVRNMSRALGQDPSRAVLPVPLNHRQINVLFGVRPEGGSQTARSLAFTRAVTLPDLVARVRVTGVRNRYRTDRRTGSASVSLGISSKPRGAPLTCRLDRGPRRPCAGRQVYRVRPGRHALTVTATDFTGRVGDRAVHRFTVERSRR